MDEYPQVTGSIGENHVDELVMGQVLHPGRVFQREEIVLHLRSQVLHVGAVRAETTRVHESLQEPGVEAPIGKDELHHLGAVGRDDLRVLRPHRQLRGDSATDHGQSVLVDGVVRSEQAFAPTICGGEESSHLRLGVGVEHLLHVLRGARLEHGLLVLGEQRGLPTTGEGGKTPGRSLHLDGMRLDDLHPTFDVEPKAMTLQIIDEGLRPALEINDLVQVSACDLGPNERLEPQGDDGVLGGVGLLLLGEGHPTLVGQLDAALAFDGHTQVGLSGVSEAGVPDLAGHGDALVEQRLGEHEVPEPLGSNTVVQEDKPLERSIPAVRLHLRERRGDGHRVDVGHVEDPHLLGVSEGSGRRQHAPRAGPVAVQVGAGDDLGLGVDSAAVSCRHLFECCHRGGGV